MKNLSLESLMRVLAKQIVTLKQEVDEYGDELLENMLLTMQEFCEKTFENVIKELS